MTLSLSGTGASTVFTQGAKVQPFKNVRVLDSLQDQSTRGTLNFTITVTDINGGAPTDALGTFALLSTSSFRQTAPGTYILNRTNPGLIDDAFYYLKQLTFTAGQTPSTAAINVNVADNLGQTATDRLTQVVAALPPAKFIVTDTINNNYAFAPSVFIHTGSGVDAIDVAGVGGRNILDGGTAGSGADTFFVDARDAASDIWNTVANFHAGDAVTLFGITPTSKAVAWADGQGATGATGLTLHATQAGAPQASFTLAGYTTADLGNGRLDVTYGTEPDGTPYLYVVGLK